MSRTIRSSCGHIHPSVPLASEMIAVLEILWQDQIRRFPELRPAFIRFDSLKSSKGYVETRCAGIQYENGEVYHDVKVLFDIVNLEVEDVMQSIYHSVVHCLNYDRGIIDTRSRSFHTEDFKKTAEEVGLETFWVDGYGYMTRIGRKLKDSGSYNMRKTRLKTFSPAKIRETNIIHI